MAISTEKGDSGETTLFGGCCVRKNDPRVYAYGMIDELNSHLSLVAAHKVSDRTKALVDRIQNELFIVGADLATPILGEPRSGGGGSSEGHGPEKQKRVSAGQVHFLTAQVRELEAYLPKLNYFIKPGGCPASALLHISRSLARRAERGAVDLSTLTDINQEVVRYLNRLSDLLFLLARLENKLNGVEDSRAEF